MVNLVAACEDDIDIVGEFPREIRIVDNLRIPLADGTELAARMWIPADAEDDPVPAVIEYIPYRQRDFTAPRDAVMHPYFAGFGYAAIRLDLRGSGDSSGAPLDEYVKQEQDDALEALAWIAAQSWCSGATGLIGISWGGFAGLQIAARRPESLRAIITVCSTDDRYADDVHYMGGCLLSNNLTWGANMLGYMCRPPDPQAVGERWREVWFERIDSAPNLVANWLQHQARDAYWRHGSVCEDYSRITCAVYAVGGWADGYSNAIPRLMQNLETPRRALIGPWAHAYPHIGVPGPGVGFLHDAVRWWDRWLKGVQNGIDAEPMMHIYQQDSVPPRQAYAQRDGNWITENGWPPSGTRNERMFLNQQGLERHAGPCAILQLRSPSSTGLIGGEWTPHGIGPEMPLDQRADDAGSLVFETELLPEPFALHGAPVATLRVAADQPLAMLAVRLVDVFADGTATRITYGLLNLTHRNGHCDPRPLTPGEAYTVQVKLNDVAQIIPAGHRIRVAVSSVYWPLAWPSPTPVTLSLSAGKCHIDLPRRTALAVESESRLGKAAMPRPRGIRWNRPFSRERSIEHDIVSGRIVHTYKKDDGAFTREDIDLNADATGEQRHIIVADDPLSARAEVQWRFELSRGEWRASVVCRMTQTADQDKFSITTCIEAFEGEVRVHTRNETHAAPRRWV